MKLIMNARLSDDFEKAIYKKAIEVAVNKINKCLTKEELDKISISFTGLTQNKLSFKIDGDENIVNKIKQILTT